MKSIFQALFVTVLLLASSLAAASDTKSITEFTTDMEVNSGFYTFYFDAANDKVYLEIPADSGEFIFQSSLPRGVGSNDLGLDRGQLGATRLVEFSVHGNRALLIEKNTTFRALTDNEMERRSVEEAFAESALFGFNVVAQNDAAVLVDYTPFLFTDINNIGQRLQNINEGSFQPDTSRSVLWPERMKSFPKNTELEAKVTFAGSNAGRFVNSVTPEPSAITVHLHHSFIALPDDGYQTRAFHPSSGYYARGFQDYAAPLQESMDQRFIARHRLEKKNPDAAVSEAVEPIIYYLDPGVPEPVRTALLEGARWWAEAFEAIGFKDAFVVKDLPSDADPMDVRYNIIQWVHRATRGWSYGASVIDPRTGEILKGHVSLGSLRVRQDMLIAQGLLAPFADGKDSEQLMADIEAMALHRIRQLSAHEIGHTIGIAHNFAANSQDRASVMDYPHPLVTINDNGEISLNNAYATGMGKWDKFTVAYGYTQFASAEAETEGLQNLIAETYAKDMHFISDRDARPVHSGHPTAHLWNNGENATDELNRLIQVRENVLARFGRDNLAPGRPLDELQQVLAPMYLLHRYQVEAAVKLVGGVDYRYVVNGEPIVNEAVSAQEQQRALAALISTLDAEFLSLPPSIEQLLVPKAYGSYDSREDFPTRMGLFTDPITMAETSVNHTLNLLLNSQRLNRLNWQVQRGGEANITPGALAKRLIDNASSNRASNSQISQRVAYLTAYHLSQAMLNSATAPEVRGQLEWALDNWRTTLQADAENGDDAYFSSYLARRLAHVLEHHEWMDAFSPAQMPPGSPI
ncbi:peptidase [Aliidiomarina shirensis]|uniref:Peptidase n=1 Tax=Aliidiomarina shirensis TaxID=1048642 RepID=A0A432WXG4_9GAMM|nr:zinc-dependent metalloprotease [Aliidiomarina shirensis]RUO38478.1 peptidase [Aliidiomarina shirensis]